MKHLTFANKSLLIGDEFADALMSYADVLIEHRTGDTVDFHAISSDGDEVTASVILAAGTPLMTESTHNRLPEPDNTEALAYIEERVALLRPVRTDSSSADASDEDVEGWLSQQY